MRQTTIFLFAAAVVALTFCAVQPAPLAAEPISQSELTTPAGTAPAQASDLNEAVAKFRNRDFDGALKLLKEAVQKNPELPPAYVVMAQLFSQANMASAVRNALEQAVVDSPNDPEAYLIMADIAIRERRVAESRLLFDKAQSLLASWNGNAKRKSYMEPRIIAGLAMTDEARGDWPAAQKRFEAWLKLEPKNAVALQQLARCLFQQKDVDGALAKLKEAAAIDKEMLTPEAVIAQFCVQTGNPQTRDWVIKALNAAPKDIKTRLFAAQWAWETGEYKDAQTQADAALKLDPKSLRAKFLLGLIALFQKNYPEAEKYFELAHLQSPKDFGASNNLALALAEQKDEAKKQQAVEYAETNVRQYPKQPESYSTYGWVLYKTGRLNEAEQALRTAISGGSFSAETAYYLARVLVDRGGNDADAKQLLEGALATTGMFSQREEAKALLDQLKKAEKTEKPKK